MTKVAAVDNQANSNDVLSKNSGKVKEMNDSVSILRNAIFTSSGRDKDITEGIAPAFLTYARNDLHLTVEFSSKLSRAEANWAFEMTKGHMETVYEMSGYGWDDEDKMRELTEQGARFLLVREAPKEEGVLGKLICFVHFRFTVQGEVMDQMAGEPCLYVWDLQVDVCYQRQGLGRHLLTLLELIARREHMSYLSVPIQNRDPKSQSWISKVRGFKPDLELDSLVNFDPEKEGFNVYSKNLTVQVRRLKESRSMSSSIRQRQQTLAAEEAQISAMANKAAPTRRSPVSVTDAFVAEEPVSSYSVEKDKESVKDESDDSDDNVVEDDRYSFDLSGLSEEDVINGLRELFKEKNGRDVTDEEVEQWMAAIKETELAGTNSV